DVMILTEGGEDGADTGYWPALAFDAQGKIHVTYCDRHNGDLRYAFETDEGFVDQAIFTQGAVGKYTALALSPSGRVSVSYYHQDEKTLNYAERDNADEPWRNEQVAWGLEVGMGSRMRLDDKGRPHIFYYTANGKFMHAWREGPNAWQKNVVENATGGFSTIT